jgi:hypothetical protein
MMLSFFIVIGKILDKNFEFGNRNMYYLKIFILEILIILVLSQSTIEHLWRRTGSNGSKPIHSTATFFKGLYQNKPLTPLILSQQFMRGCMYGYDDNCLMKSPVVPDYERISPDFKKREIVNIRLFIRWSPSVSNLTQTVLWANETSAFILTNITGLLHGLHLFFLLIGNYYQHFYSQNNGVICLEEWNKDEKYVLNHRLVIFPEAVANYHSENVVKMWDQLHKKRLLK